MNIKYYLADPAGNITALVISAVPKDNYKSIAQGIMKKHVEVEQVGFVSFTDNLVKLNMSGDEFCGNAAMSAAALYYMISGKRETFKTEVSVFGSRKPVEVKVKKSGEFFECECKLFPPVSIDKVKFEVENTKYCFPLVCYEGIKHIIADETLSKATALSIIKKLADNLSAKALGIMLLNEDKTFMTPLVYVKDADTLFFEKSCASGSCAVASICDFGKRIELVQPGGVISAVNAEKISLFGKVKFSKCYLEEF